MQLFYNATNTFTCNGYIYSKVYDAEIQTEIDNSIIYIKKYNKMKNKIWIPLKNIHRCGDFNKKKKYFTEFSFICNDEQLIDLAGVTFNNFQLLLKTLATNYRYSINSFFYFNYFFFLNHISSRLRFYIIIIIYLENKLL